MYTTNVKKHTYKKTRKEKGPSPVAKMKRKGCHGLFFFFFLGEAVSSSTALDEQLFSTQTKMVRGCQSSENLAL